MRLFGILVFQCLFFTSLAQEISGKLQKAITQLASDPQFAHAAISMSVQDTKTGEWVFRYNHPMGLIPASTLKVCTAASALEILGPDYQFTTQISLLRSRSGKGRYYIRIDPSGDPSLGSSRFPQPDFLIESILQSCERNGIKNIAGILIQDSLYDWNPIPDGWLWQDIGNYYGAGSFAFNWKENSCTLHFKTDPVSGKPATLLHPKMISGIPVLSEVVSGPPGSGDNSYAYSFPYTSSVWVKGTLPPGEKEYTIRASVPDPLHYFLEDLRKQATAMQISVDNEIIRSHPFSKERWPSDLSILDSFRVQSPPLGLLTAAFLDESINLYGEAFLKNMALLKKGRAHTDSGTALLLDFWKSAQILPEELHITDGSGLSPYNRVTSSALTRIMVYASRQPWFDAFFKALPEQNGLKMKSGYISGVRSYTGYVQAKGANRYAFSILVNYFTGSPSTSRKKIWTVLDQLKN